MVELEPLGDRMLVRILKRDEVTAGGVHLPEQARERSQRGAVLAVGPGRTTDAGVLVPLAVEPGAVVHFSKYGGTEVEFDVGLGLGEEQLLVLRESDVLGVEVSKGAAE